MKLLNTYQSFAHKDDNGGGDKDTNTALLLLLILLLTTATKKKNETSFKQLDHFQPKGEGGDKKQIYIELQQTICHLFEIVKTYISQLASSSKIARMKSRTDYRLPV